MSSIGGIYGLSGSGMDIDAMVTKLMTGQQAKADALLQKKTVAQWQKTAYNTAYDDIDNFRTAVFNYKLQGTLNPNKVTSSNTSVATATANSDAGDVNHSLVVTQLAEGVKLTSSINITAANAKKDTVANQFYGGATGVPTGSIQVKISNGTMNASLTVSTSGTINDFVSQINNAGINVKANYDSTLDRFFLYDTNTGAATGIGFDGSSAEGMDFVLNKLKLPGLAMLNSTTSSSDSVGTVDPTKALSTQFAGLPTNFTLKLANPKVDSGSVKTIDINTATNTLNDLMGALNASGATASFDQSTGKFTITPTDGGTLDFSGSDSSGLAFVSSSLKLSISNHSGKDAIINLDGANGITESSNNFTISGVTYNLTGTTPFTSIQDPSFPTDPTKTITSQQATSIAVSYDVDKAVSSIQSLVDSYNKILEEVNGKLDETRYSEYPPLTDAQKTNMKDSDITAWNAKAQSGMLHHDTTLTSLVNTMRNAFTNPISGITGKYNSGASIGITTGAYTEGGKLSLDTDKLRKAINSDHNVLTQLFGASGQTTKDGVTTTNTQTQGIAGRLYDGIKTPLDKLVQIAGITSNAQYDTSSNYAKRIAAYKTQISVQADRFSTIESAYYKKYNAMEVALQQLSSQSSWLSSMLSSSSS